jgi:hypothetical protein
MEADQSPFQVSGIPIREFTHLNVHALGERGTSTYVPPDPSPTVEVQNAAEVFERAFQKACVQSKSQLRLETKALQSSTLPKQKRDDRGMAESTKAGVSGIVIYGPSFLVPHRLTGKHGVINWQLKGGPTIYVVIDPDSTDNFKTELDVLIRTANTVGSVEDP